MDTFLTFLCSRTFIRNGEPTKSTVLQGASNEGAGKGFRVKIKNKILLKTFSIL